VKVAIGADHGGFALKEYLKTLTEFDWIDVGTFNTDSVDYPDYAQKVSDLLIKQEADFGILICKSGIGMSIAANRFQGIYAALCFNKAMAESARTHNNANILCLAAAYTANSEAKEMIDTFLNTSFSEDTRHARRFEKINNFCN
jgi:ribose 5-phosphate isomerase B